MTLSQAIARTGRLPLPVPTFALDGVGRLLRLFGSGFSAGQVRSLAVGRVMDTSQLQSEVGFTPRYSSPAAFDDFAASLFRPIKPGTAHRVEERLDRLIGASPAQPPRPQTVPPPSTGAPGTKPSRRRHLRPVAALSQDDELVGENA